jgi:preprotein translocase subunit SecA
MSILDSLFGGSNEREVKHALDVVQTINGLEEKYKKMKDADFPRETDALKKRLADGESLDDILPEAFALVREASRRKTELRPFDVQLVGGIVLHEGKISEMKTGEGKTLVATLPAYLNALTGEGVHIVTVNDYLARRDAGWMGPIYHLLGISTGVIVHESGLLYDPDYSHDELDDKTKHLRPVERKDAYIADITYGTNNEFGFDYLRDNMVTVKEQRVQRSRNFAIVDEVDSILIDEARTPLIISAPAEESTDKYYQFAKIIPQLKAEEDYTVDEKLKAASLTDSGIAKIERILGMGNVYEEGGIEIVHHIEQALRAQTLYHRDRDYVVREGEVIIVDEFTGRLMQGRRYSEGLHQAIEAKEDVQIQQESMTLATITFQNYFRLYKKLAGMTGTAATEAEEFSKIYELDVVEIPTNKPMVRKDLHDSVYKSEAGKYKAAVREIKQLHEAGKPVLVGTISIEKSEYLSQLLHKEKVPHTVLNAKFHEKEAMIISKAGEKGGVTIATNMAGRGTDIKLADGVADSGGLHILGTERHESRRIDNQLRGRAGRQGDPGSTQFLVSLEDDLMRLFGSERVAGMMDRLGMEEDMPIEHGLITRSIESAQRKVEGRNFDIRKNLVEYDDVMNKHREVIYDRRNEIVDEKDIREEIIDTINRRLSAHIHDATADPDPDNWDIEGLYTAVAQVLPADKQSTITEMKKFTAVEQLEEYLHGFARALYEEREKTFGEPNMRIIERAVSLRTIDLLWVEHLDAMEHLRDGIGLRGYGQRDPLIEYKQESYSMFEQLLDAIDDGIANTIFRVTITQAPPQTQRAEPEGAEETPKPGTAPSTEVKNKAKRKRLAKAAKRGKR